MKNIFKNKLKFLLGLALIVSSCNDFDDINKNPSAIPEEKTKVEFFLDNSIIKAQMDPHISERVFVLYWKTAAHQYNRTGISGGNLDDDWSKDYYIYMSEWLNSANTAIDVAKIKIAKKEEFDKNTNLLQVSRIWRAYLMSEMSDSFGPISINAFQGVNPEYTDVKTVYYHLLDELKDASSKLNIAFQHPDEYRKHDIAYAFDYVKWQKYANSMRLRLAMRLSEVDPVKAKTEFEDAVKLPLITNTSETFKVNERDGWDPLVGNMTRTWDAEMMHVTFNNLVVGLGGIPSQSQVPATMVSSIKPANYIGQRYLNHFSQKTNEPAAGYWLDGLPQTIDPRAYKSFIIPGDFDNPDFSNYPAGDSRSTIRTLTNSSNVVVKTIDAKYTWNAFAAGDWGTMGATNLVRSYSGTIPRLSHKFRNSTNSRIFFAPWETYFLIAEASVRGWTVPMFGKDAYETGITLNFAYWDVSQHLGAYLTSQDYNRAGTSVSWNHTAEPPATYTMNYIDGYTNVPGTVQIKYPVNNLYKNGSIKNDLLTKIITQKYLAQNPYLPLEVWNDQRRLGLPFFENPVIETPLLNLPDLDNSNYMTSKVSFFPQRLAYPSNFRNSNPKGYSQAVQNLGGNDDVHTPLWWAKKN